MNERVLSREEIIDRLIPVFKNSNTNKAILFGSYAKGTQTEKSDIDILVDSGLHGLKFFGLLEDVCSVVDRPVDLIDVYQLKRGERWKKIYAKQGWLFMSGHDENGCTSASVFKYLDFLRRMNCLPCKASE